MDRRGRDARLVLIAGRQAGAFSYAQAVEAGFPHSTIGRRLGSGAWERRFPGVYVMGGTPAGREGDLWCAVLAVGGDVALTHETSALLHGAEGLPLSPITLTARHGSHHRLGGLFVHQIDDLVTWHRTSVRGLPVSSAERAVVELGATQPERVVGRVADDLVRGRATTYDRIAAVLAQVARPGKPGVEKVARTLDERVGGYVPPASELERAFFSALEAGGLPAPIRQLPLPGRAPGLRGLVDAAYPDAQMVMEVDGRRWHTRMEASRADRERDAQVVRAGWVPLRFVYEQVVGHPGEVCATVRETRELRMRQLGRAA